MKLTSAYEPGKYEADIYSLWERGRVFIANPHSPKDHFSLSMPPPNETGTLHVGHALFITLQDIIARHARQQNKDVLWLPGTDHAALATNAVVERMLAEQGTNKHALGREEFLSRTKAFVGDSRNTINTQIRAMGASVDWSRARYTLDPMLNRCVNEVFKLMYEDGLIYRGSRIVNWDPKLETTVSDDEVVYKEEKAPFYTLQYGPFQIGTSRPETKFGDKYVVMHPDDKRYVQYKHGDSFEAEWINGPVKATVIKDEAIDPAFGTGVMTITPWHDHTDFDIAERHGLDKQQIIGFDGKLLPIAGEFAGLQIDKARPKIVAKLKAKGLLVNQETYTHNIAQNDRGKGVIEPQIMLQWFVDVNRPVVDWKGQLRSLREVMRAVIDDDDIKIIPKRFEKIYFHWIDNLHDWCISRQIWWGHRIPVWYKDEEIYVGVKAPAGQGWHQDPDTLDTWFSSALWTWSTLLNPQLADNYSLNLGDLLERSPDFKTYHPTSVMETGWDILFFWVARMILATTYVMSSTGQPADKRVPFRQVYLHGLVRHESGRKMSKSDPDTIIDPLEVIPDYGADALRLALVSGMNAGQDSKLGRSKIVDNRNFCNKLWNIARFIEGAGEANAKPELKTIADHWILNKLSKLTGEVDQGVDNFRFSEAYQKLYHFVWDDFADWYVEASKAGPNPALLRYVLEVLLITAHPFAPFLTEVIWQELALKKDHLLALQQQPEVPKADANQAKQFEEVQKIVKEMRRWKTLLDSSKFAYTKSQLIEANEELIKKLSKASRLTEQAVFSGLKLKLTDYEIGVDADKDMAQAFIDGVKKDIEAMQSSIKNLQSRLTPAYEKNAPRELVDGTKKEIETQQEKLDSRKEELKMVTDWISR